MAASARSTGDNHLNAPDIAFDKRLLTRVFIGALVTQLVLQWIPLAIASLSVPMAQSVLENAPDEAAHIFAADRFASARWRAFLVESMAAFGVLVVAFAVVRVRFSSSVTLSRGAFARKVLALVGGIALADASVSTLVRTLCLHPLDVEVGLSQLSAFAFARSTFADALTTTSLDAALFLIAFAAWMWRPRALLIAAPACAVAHAVSGWLLVAWLQPALAPVQSAAEFQTTCANARCVALVDVVEQIAADHRVHAPQTTLYFVKTSTFDQRVAAFASGPPALGALWFFDSSLRALSPAGARSMALHEVGHFVFGHAWIEAAIDGTTAFAFALLWLVVARRSRSLQIVLAWWLLATAAQTMETPARLWVRRTFERQADAFAVEHGGWPAFVEVERVGNRQNLARYSEREIVRVLLLDHDPPALRLRQVPQEGF